MSSNPYQVPAKFVNKLLDNSHGSNKQSLKSLVFDSKRNTMKCSKSTYATICQTMRYKPTLDKILTHNDHELQHSIMDESHNKGLVYVLLYELLFGKFKSIRGGGQLKRLILKHREALNAYVEVVGGGPEVTVLAEFPRYVRVNPLVQPDISTVMVARELATRTTNNEHNDDNNETADIPIYRDAHVPDLLVLPPRGNANLFTHPYVRDGKIVLQDKSSCFPAMALIHGRNPANDTDMDGYDVIDACAAPGNKTCHLAALLQQRSSSSSHTNQTSTVFACDRDQKRCELLQRRMTLLAPSTPPTKSKKQEPTVHVEPIHGDFLKLSPTDERFTNVRAILLDPSCSGSGIINQPDRLIHNATADPNAVDDEETVKDRLTKLSNFQCLALKHAMSFPQVTKIVYSTCSIHEEENEGVVSQILTESSGSGWELKAPHCFDHWTRRGRPVCGLTEAQAQCLIRCNGHEDETNGFFVSYFERVSSNFKNGGTAAAIPTKTKPSNQIATDEAVKDVAIYNGEYKQDPKVQSESVTVSNTKIDRRIAPTKDSNKPNHSNKKREPKSTKDVPNPTKRGQKRDPTNDSSNTTKTKTNRSPKKRKSLSKQKRDTSTEDPNVPTQHGQKRDVPNDSSNTTKQQRSKKRKSSSGPTQTNTDEAVHAKKRDKRMKWKLAQKEKKALRLLKKKVTPNVSKDSTK